MLPIPTMSTETVASCAEARQTGAPKMIDANRDRFIMHQIIPAPLARTLKHRLSRKFTDRVVYIEECRNDARKLRGTIEGSVNVDLYSITTN